MIIDLITGLAATGPAHLIDLESPSPEGADVLAIPFESFTDGRGYSVARILRRQGFEGVLRAVGDNGLDQLFYLRRCGFDQAEISAADFGLLKPEHLRPFTVELQPAERPA